MQTKGRDILGSRSNVQRPGGKKNLISLQNVMEFSSAGDWNLKKKRCIIRRRKINGVQLTKSLVYYAKKYALSLKSHVFSSIKELFWGVK